ncbi:DUF1700 domain-containing protein [Pediococcus claussenii]|uniref:DUF1700 domain-containing protein n=1 Tax=Pediococcus claussenii (strain ATCC BAA-344 / DSM 14800 / JCM 18046 / KCTC 3811 / LMG 21948 / P06) TaxID=701521 RepID=G8PAU9_PEDCP|nr:DUF1700 domain-containing protein [Pediococcus claussenii]AEV95817.1 hypothetical protein PECL_1599 [Pediococcus claussenii ATCC BAA-344]ANZ69314.1 hypothetical protein AYR57_02905 [Pediococcus claussenii]ANZ71134.1 hypothetical protein AYR58_02920 [Pediococcus claussenii]KRN20424.1 hypothetical protein IV79_GL000479 [Pediococcus claussenii]
MDRYLEELKGYLKALPESDRDDAIEYYQEYLMDAGVRNYDDAVQKLGSARRTANKVQADRAVESTGNESRFLKKSKNTNPAMVVWLVILALLSSPVTIPLAILLGSIVLVIVLMLLTVVAIPLMIGLVSIYIGFRVLFMEWAVGLFYIGIGLASLGVMLFIVPAATLGLNSLKKLAVRIYRRAFGHRKVEME